MSARVNLYMYLKSPLDELLQVYSLHAACINQRDVIYVWRYYKLKYEKTYYCLML